MSLLAEQKNNRRNTSAFIAARPSLITLTPCVSTKTPSGGFAVTDGTNRYPQTLRLIEAPAANNNQPGLLTASDGKQRRVSYQLLGVWDAVMDIFDHWDVNGLRYEVVELLPYNGYERRGKVVQYGESAA
jgi:hypothetical protein